MSTFIQQKLAAKNKPTIKMGFPDRTTIIGKMINDFLKSKVEVNNETIHLLFSANRYENLSKIKHHLEFILYN